MRQAGRVSGWNDAGGYGFVVPHDGGRRAFVHASAFQPGSRGPVDGDLVSYAVSTDARGRANATDVRFAGQGIERRKARAPIPRLAIGVAFLLAVAAGAVLGFVPAVVAIGYAVLSVASCLMYGLDKAAAGQDRQRTPEGTLHLVGLLGGWPGALIAQQAFRHKTTKASFQSVFRFTVLANLAALGWLVASGTAQSLAASLSGG